MTTTSNIITVSQDMNNKLTRVEVGDFIVWFSYETPVAFYAVGSPRVVSENVWSNTTGRHLAAIDGGDKAAKAARIPREEFVRLYNEATGTLDKAIANAF